MAWGDNITMNNGIIYACIHKSTGKRYIGSTIQGLIERKRSHLLSCNTRPNKHNSNSSFSSGSYDSKFYTAIRNCGFNDFEWIVLHKGLNLEEIYDYEMAYILLYDTINSGYNSEEPTKLTYNTLEI